MCITEKKIIYRSFALSLFHHVALFLSSYPAEQRMCDEQEAITSHFLQQAKAKPLLPPPAEPSPIPPVDSRLTNQLTLPHKQYSTHDDEENANGLMVDKK